MNPPIPDFYDKDNARELVGKAAAAYQNAVGDDALGIWDSRTDTHVAIWESSTDLIVAFRGTADIRNWLTDLDARLVVEDECKIHAGFWLALGSVIEKVNKLVFDNGYKSRRIWLTGHSLGGALALLYGWRMASLLKSQPFAGIYTFGQPRVGNAAFRDSWAFRDGLNSCTFRVVNAVDLVPHVPWLCGRFRHCAHEVFYDVEDGPTPVIDRTGVAYALDDIFTMMTVWGRWNNITQWLADHHVSRYQALFTGGT